MKVNMFLPLLLVITRVVRGWPDEAGAGYFKTFSYFKSNIEGSPDNWYGGLPDSNTLWKLKFTQGYLDKEPDIFYFNFDGYSGRIIFNENREPICLPFQNFKIEGSINDSWTITTPEGKRYYFGKKEHTTFKFGGSFISTWHLTSITTPKSNEMIQFEYQDNPLGWNEDVSTLPKSQSFSKRTSPGEEKLPFCHSENLQEEVQTITSAHLIKITFPTQNLNIVFNYANDRQDIGAEQSVKRLAGIDIYHGEKLIKSYTLINNAYFIGSDSVPIAYLNKRLRLNSITNNIDNTSYTFEYYDEYQMPSYISPDTDHWGFYNSAGNNSLLPNTIPEEMSQTHYISTTDLTANKETNPNSVKACALKKITYPTGGSSQFTWETNVISYDSISESKKKLWDIYYERNNYTPSWAETSFINHMKSLYVDDPDIQSARIRMKAYNKNQNGPIDISIAGVNPGVSGYYSVYLYKFMDEIMPEGIPPLTPLPFDIMNHPDCRKLSNNQTLTIDRGAYYLILLATNNPNVSYMSAKVNFEEDEQIRYIDKNVGGIRTKEIKHMDDLSPENVVTHQYYYKRDFLVSHRVGEPVSYQRSSSKLFLNPYYSDYKYHYELKCAQSIVATSYLVNNQGEPHHSEGSHIGYSEVSEIISDSNGFKTTKFWNEEDVTRRNLVMSEHWYYNTNIIIKEILNSYASNSSFQSPFQRLNIRLVHSYRIPDQFDILDILFSTLSPTEYYNGWFYKNKTIEKRYTEGGVNFVRDSVLYYYDSATSGKHSFLTRKRSFNSDKSEVIETYKYALDFTPSGNFIKQMVDNHIVNEPIEYIRKEKSAIVTAYYKKYITNNSRDIYECDFSKYPAISFGIDEYGNLTSSTFYKKRYSLNLDASGNLLSINKEDISPTSFIYGYNNTKTIVAIENIDYSQISTAILSSIRNHTFSESGQVGDIIADINFVKSSLGSLYKDKNCLITIYTYKPLVGVTSMTNPLEATIFFEYDLSGRLQYIKDNNGKVIEHYKYHFKP